MSEQRPDIPPALIEAFSRLCEGDFAFRMPRTNRKDAEDTAAFFFNSIADELSRILRESREQETRLGETAERLTAGLTRVAAGDLNVQIERDFKGDPVDVLVFLVNSTIAEIAHLYTENQRLAEEARQRLERLVEQRTRELRTSEENFRHLFDAAPVPQLLIQMEDATIAGANDRACAALGLDKEKLASLPARTIFDNGEDLNVLLERMAQAETLESKALRLRGQGAEPFWALVSARPLHLDGQLTVVVGFNDLTEQKGIEARLEELAHRDELTGALNRRKLLERGTLEVERSQRFKRPLCLAMLDLDFFKRINDGFGHAVGDKALKLVATTVQAQLRKQDMLARFGGEEFTVLLVELDRLPCEKVLERLRAAVEGLAMIDAGRRIPLSVSIGATCWRPDDDLQRMIERADQALYTAKANGRNRVSHAEHRPGVALGDEDMKTPPSGWMRLKLPYREE
jgi:diguanylate cyclase (GGDEF)-like protein/PAS domain S-box-containing protein